MRCNTPRPSGLSAYTPENGGLGCARNNRHRRAVASTCLSRQDDYLRDDTLVKLSAPLKHPPEHIYLRLFNMPGGEKPESVRTPCLKQSAHAAKTPEIWSESQRLQTGSGSGSFCRNGHTFPARVCMRIYAPPSSCLVKAKSIVSLHSASTATPCGRIPSLTTPMLPQQRDHGPFDDLLVWFEKKRITRRYRRSLSGWRWSTSISRLVRVLRIDRKSHLLGEFSTIWTIISRLHVQSPLESLTSSQNWC